MNTYYHFKIKGSQNKSPVLLTQAGLGIYKTLIDRANAELQRSRKPLLCAKVSLDANPIAIINAGQIIVNPEDLPDDMAYIEFMCVADMQLVMAYKRAIELQQEIDRLRFAPPKKYLAALAMGIENAADVEDISGAAVDALMYQLWLRDEELIGNMGYQYQTPEEPKDPDDQDQAENPDNEEIPLF